MRSKFPCRDLAEGALALDASGMLNFLGTGLEEELLDNLGRPIIMASKAIGELKYHPIDGQDIARSLERLKSRGILSEVGLGHAGHTIYSELAGEGIGAGLDDGEAATIALAIEHAATTIVVLDERKATRLFNERWPERLAVGTVTLLALTETRGITREKLGDACCSALTHARMRVPAEAVDWVIELIGAERACSFRALQKAMKPR